MPNTKSAKKALRQNEKRRIKNLSQKRGIKRAVKNYKSILSDGGVEDARKQLSSLYKNLDKAAKSGVIKKNKSSRMKSRLARRLNTPTENGDASLPVNSQIE